MSEDLRLSVILEKVEKAHIERVLIMTNWNRTKAAVILGVCYRKLLYRIKKYGYGKHQVRDFDNAANIEPHGKYLAVGTPTGRSSYFQDLYDSEKP